MMATCFCTPSQIYNGPSALSYAAPHFCQLGKKAFLVSDETMVKLGNLELLCQLLTQQQIEYFIYSKINSEPTDLMIENGLEYFKQQKCDFFIAMGGGSVIDSMKAIALLSVSQQTLDAWLKKEVSCKLAPMVAIPTTAGTGSEATQFTIITNTTTQVKMLLKGISLIPTLAILDPSFTMSLPPNITSSTGIDALCHALEAFSSIHCQPLSETFAISAMQRIFTYLPLAYQQGDHQQARYQMSLASLEAGIAFNNSSVTLIHGMSRPLGALFHIPHGLSNAVLLNACLHFILPSLTSSFSFLARACHLSDLEDDKLASLAFVNHVQELLITLQIPSLSKLVPDANQFYDNLDKMARDAIESGSVANTKVECTQQQIKSCYIQAYQQK